MNHSALSIRLTKFYWVITRQTFWLSNIQFIHSRKFTSNITYIISENIDGKFEEISWNIFSIHIVTSGQIDRDSLHPRLGMYITIYILRTFPSRKDKSHFMNTYEGGRFYFYKSLQRKKGEKMTKMLISLQIVIIAELRLRIPYFSWN